LTWDNSQLTLWEIAPQSDGVRGISISFYTAISVFALKGKHRRTGYQDNCDKRP
jgi:hypothetical protein